jgi:Uma2 family endonuclease
VEVLSPDDRFARVQVRLQEILAFGVPMIWVVDPYERVAWTVTPGGHLTRVEDGTIRCPELAIALPLAEIWPED